MCAIIASRILRPYFLLVPHYHTTPDSGLVVCHEYYDKHDPLDKHISTNKCIINFFVIRELLSEFQW